MFAFPYVQVFPVQPPLGFPGTGYLACRIPAEQAVEVDGLPVAGDGLACTPRHTVGVTVHIRNQLFQHFHRRAVIGKDGLQVILPLVQTAEQQVLHVVLAAVEADIVGVFLCVGLFRAVLLLYGEPLSRYLHIVADRQDEELPGGEVHRHHEFRPHFLGPPGR